MCKSCFAFAFQVTDSGQKTKQELKDHFMGLKKKLDEALELRLSELLSEVEELETESLQPLEECGDIIEQGISRAARVMEEGKVCGGNHLFTHSFGN